MKHRFDILDLSCARGDRPLFGGLNASLHSGQLLHVVGSNGSGKTTLLRSLCGLTRPLTGEVRWNDKPIDTLGDDYRAALAYLGHSDGVQRELTLRENLEIAAQLLGVNDARIDYAVEQMELLGYEFLPAKILSQGQRRRLALARVLLSPSPLWILDEPFNGLDVRSFELLKDLLSEHLSNSGLVILSSHQELNLVDTHVVRIDLDLLRADPRGALAA